MAKGTGLIGNFKGKVGNTVGYKLSASNNGQTQGIRVYQPIVKNPKTAAQAEQRAKLLAVNATYRALKMVIDRGNEGLPYGNKSRLAWLKGALKSEQMPWYEKGSAVMHCVGCQLTKGSLSGIIFSVETDMVRITCAGVASETPMTTIGALSAALLDAYPSLKAGDQVTIVTEVNGANGINSDVFSFVLNTTSTEDTDRFSTEAGTLIYEAPNGNNGAAIIVSRLGDNGEHLRTNSFIQFPASVLAAAPYDADSKAAAIASYQSSGYVNADWSEEPID